VAVETYETQLERVQARIKKLEDDGVQQYGRGDRSVVRLELRTLYEREQWLRGMVERESRGGIRGRLATPV
jgi:hypothetical protein